MALLNQLSSLAGQSAVGNGHQGVRYGLTVAEVTSTRDPEKHGRVRCRMLNQDKNAGDLGWAYVATPFAGKGGILFLPNEKDMVLVAFEGGDIRRPFIIGSFWAGSQSPPHMVEEKNDTYLIQTPGKNQIVLHDGENEQAVTIETPGGQKCVLDDKEKTVRIGDKEGKNSITIHSESGSITLKSANKLTIEVGGEAAPVHVEIDGESKSFKISGVQTFSVDSVQMNLEAKGTASIKASAEVTVQSDGVTAVKGGIIKLN